MYLSRLEIAALRAAEIGTLVRFRGADGAPTYAPDREQGPFATVRTVVKLARFGFLRMDDSTEARLTDFGRAALRALPTPRRRGRPRTRSAA